MLNIEKLLIEKTKYNGNTEPNVKSISASDFGNDILQIYLRYKHGVQERMNFGQDTIGSIMHIGIQELLKDEYEIEKRLDLLMNNGWWLSGSIDLLSNKEIIDIKVTKEYTIEKILKEPNHQYIWQLSVYRYLVKKLLNIDVETKLLLILKDGGYDFRKNQINPSFKVLDIEPKSFDEVENKFNEIVSQIEKYDEIGVNPPQCNDLWFRKTKNGATPMRCEFYCSYKDVCPYYNVNPNKINF